MSAATFMILSSCGFVCGLSILVGFVIGKARESANSLVRKNLLVYLGLLLALVCGSATVFLLGVLVFSHSNNAPFRAIVFCVAVAVGALTATYVHKLSIEGGMSKS